MKRFAKVLGRINEQLILPQPHKYRVMKELADDLDDLYEYYRNGGDDDETAIRRAEEKIDADPETLRLLIKLNDSPVNAFIRRFSPQSRKRFETALWIVLALTVGLPMLKLAIAPDGTVTSPGMFFWPVFGLTLSGIVVSAMKGYELFILQKHHLQKRGPALLYIKFCAMECFILTLSGLVYEVSRTTGILAQSLTNMELLLSSMIHNSLSIVLTGTLATALIGLLWIILTLKSVGIEEKEKVFAFHA